jgi:transcriptional regulator with XRE-family HTH domain
VTAEQCREARRLLGWRAEDLASHAQVARNTVLRFERGETGIKSRTITDLRRVLEEKGVRFVLGAETIILRDGTRVPVEGRTVLLADGSMVCLRRPPS